MNQVRLVDVFERFGLFADTDRQRREPDEDDGSNHEALHREDRREELVHDRHRLDELDTRLNRPHEGGKLMVDRIDKLLTWIDALDNLVAERLLLYRLQERLDDRQRDIRLKKRHANLSQRVLDILFAELPGADPAPDVAEAFR